MKIALAEGELTVQLIHAASETSTPFPEHGALDHGLIKCDGFVEAEPDSDYFIQLSLQRKNHPSSNIFDETKTIIVQCEVDGKHTGRRYLFHNNRFQSTRKVGIVTRNENSETLTAFRFEKPALVWSQSEQTVSNPSAMASIKITVHSPLYKGETPPPRPASYFQARSTAGTVAVATATTPVQPQPRVQSAPRTEPPAAALVSGPTAANAAGASSSDGSSGSRAGKGGGVATTNFKKKKILRTAVGTHVETTGLVQRRKPKKLAPFKPKVIARAAPSASLPPPNKVIQPFQPGKVIKTVTLCYGTAAKLVEVGVLPRPPPPRFAGTKRSSVNDDDDDDDADHDYIEDITKDAKKNSCSGKENKKPVIVDLTLQD